jgi:foldase protein PrsA
LDQLITERLLEQEAAKANVKVTDEDIEKEIADIKKQFPSEDQFNMILAQNGMTLDTLKEQMQTQLLISKIFEPQIEISEESMKKYFEDNKQMFEKPEEIKASHILVDSKEEAEKILAELKNGGDFAKLAKENSKDGSKDQGGDLGYFPRGKMVPEFEEVAFTLEPGAISDVVKSEFGYHIIKVTDKKPAQAANFEENKADIKKQLFNEELAKKGPEWLDKIKAEADIKNNLTKDA